MTRSPLSTSPLQRHWGERNRQCSACCLYTPLPTHRIRIEVRTPLTWIPVHATREAVISATKPSPMPAMGILGVVICVLGGLQSHLRLEAQFPVLDTVFKPCMLPPPLSVVIGRVCVRGSCELCSILCTAIHPTSFIRHCTSIQSLTARLHPAQLRHLLPLHSPSPHLSGQYCQLGPRYPSYFDSPPLPCPRQISNPNPTHPTTTNSNNYESNT